MSALKRDSQGVPKQHGKMGPPKPPQKPVVQNAFTPMFEQLRDELDEHHDRRERLVKASRDVTALSKKIIFSLQRVRKIDADLPKGILSEVQTNLAAASKHLCAIAPEVQGINRYRYERQLLCLEELVEALTFMHYLKTQTLLRQQELDEMLHHLLRPAATPSSEDTAQQQSLDETSQPSVFSLTSGDYINGVFDLTGEMMRFATTASALTGAMASADGAAANSSTSSTTTRPRTIVQDMQDLGSFFAMLPNPHDKKWPQKMEVMQQSVQKVERLGYDRTVRGSERPAGWVPDLSSAENHVAEA